LYRKYQAQGLVILGFPCNQFGNQEPGDEQSISENCLVNYGVTFPMFSKIEVNGENAHPIYQYLKNEISGPNGDEIEWNFAKFLINSQGHPVERFSPKATPEEIEPYLAETLQ
jgi:glutathione peroxidase